MKQVKCKSGITGWQSRLRKVYDTFDQFQRLSEFYGLHTRLGYKTARAAWRNNPIVQGSTVPSDYRRVKVH